MDTMILNCENFGSCGGCTSESSNYQDHLHAKLQNFKDLAKDTLNIDLDPQCITPTSYNFRSKADFIVEQIPHGSMNAGFYTKYSDKLSKTLLDIKRCPLFSDSLQELYTQFRSHIPQIKKGSVRIRVSPSKKGTSSEQKGIWLDFSNEDIRNLLDEKKTLKQLLRVFDVIEIGQKRKVLNPDTLKLNEAQAYPWFETYVQDRPVPLFTNIASFTQTGFESNRLLVAEVDKILKKINVSVWFEACSGSGNFTLPLANSSKKVIATEIDVQAFENMNRTLAYLKDATQFSHIPAKIVQKTLNIHKESSKLLELLSECDGVFVDPPRSGLQDFITALEKVSKKPQSVIYVSCHSESFLNDAKKLIQIGYTLKELIGVDQFPFSKHCEWVSLFEI